MKQDSKNLKRTEDSADRGSVSWLKSHKPYILGIMGREKQTEPRDEYHVHYPLGANQSDLQGR